LCGTGCLKNACGKKPLGFGRTIATVALAIPAWTTCTFSLKHLPQTKRCLIGEQGEHDEQIRIVIGNSFAGISSSVCVNHLWPVVAGGGGMKDEIEVHNAAVEAMFKKLKPIIEGDSSSVVLHALLVVLAMCGQQTALEPDVFKALVVQELDRLMLVNAERKGMLS
jgi:hypothetical protein